MPTQSKRHAVIAAVVARLAKIRSQNGYATDIGRTQFVGEVPTLGSDDPPDAMSVVVGTERQEWQGKKLYVTLPIEVQILVAPGQEAWQSQEWGVTDVKRAMEVDFDLGGLLEQQFPIKRGPVQTYPRESGHISVGAGVPYEFTYTEGWGAP